MAAVETELNSDDALRQRATRRGRRERGEFRERRKEKPSALILPAAAELAVRAVTGVQGGPKFKSIPTLQETTCQENMSKPCLKIA